MILAALAAVTVTVMGSPGPVPGAATQAEPMPNAYHQPAYCRQVVDKEVARQNVALKGLRPMAQYAVVRELDGCSVPTPVGYHPAAAAPVTREDAPANRR